ncbi:MAG: magnesium transporter [Planctomycetia bacterium]|nr:magnesium transporter [Planctomycetia bacterium]
MKKEMFSHEISMLRDTFRRLINRKANTNLVKLIEKTHSADLAVIYRFFTDNEQNYLFNLMTNNEYTAEFLSELDDSILEDLLEDIAPERIVPIIRIASSDDQTAILNAISEEKSKIVIDSLHSDEQEEIEEMLAYPEDSAGSMMSTDVFTLNEGLTAGEAINDLQNQEGVEMVFYLYVTDAENHLVGVISLRDLVTTHSSTKLKDIMIRKVQYVRAETDQEEVAKIVSHYNLLAVPVVDSNDEILGIVTVDDVVDVIREEATEDFLQMAGAGKDREILLKSSWGNAKSRFPWLFATWIGGIFTMSIIGFFENTLQSIITLAAFIPIIAGMGGNIGTQSSTIIVRGIATGRIDFGSDLKLILKELSVGLILGLTYGLLLGSLAYLFLKDVPTIFGMVVGLSICATMVLAASIGTSVPLLLRKLNVDPAIATGPFVTTTTDIIGIGTYFLIASALLPL